MRKSIFFVSLSFSSFSAVLIYFTCFSLATPEDPTVLLWSLMCLAQHADKLGQHTRALSLLDEAVAHTPTRKREKIQIRRRAEK